MKKNKCKKDNLNKENEELEKKYVKIAKLKTKIKNILENENTYEKKIEKLRKR